MARTRIAKTKMRSLVIASVTRWERGSHYSGRSFRLIALPRGLTPGPLYKLLPIGTLETGNLYASFGCERRQHCNPKNEARLDFPLA